MNLKYMNVSLFEIGYKKNEISHHILIFGDVSVNFKNGGGEKTQQSTVKFYSFFSHLHCFLLPLQSCTFTYINNHLMHIVCLEHSKNSIYFDSIWMMDSIIDLKSCYM